jgi:hypothetical protein
MSEMRTALRESLNKTFKSEFNNSVARLRENISPYTAYVHAENEQALKDQTALADVLDKLETLNKEIDTLISPLAQ